MASPSRAVDPEQLLAQAGWVRGLVQRLVQDDGLAEDVLQDTWMAALRQPAHSQARGGLPAWLAAVARNLALRRRRREAVRAAVERAAARSEAVDGGQEEVERMQLQRALVDAVLALDEPYRSAVILRHLDGLSAAEIARRQGCTRDVARQRVSRGLAELRARLARRYGPDGGACAALVPLLGRGWDGSALAGGIVVGGKLTLGIAGAALAALALWMATADGGERSAAPRTEQAGPGGAAERAGPEGLRAGSTELAAAAVAAEVTAAPDARVRLYGPADEAAPTALQVRGRITDTGGRPLADALVQLVGAAQAPDWKSDADGSFGGELPSEARDALALHASCAGFLPRTVALDPHQPITIELQALPALAGRLLDPSGAPVAPPGYVKAVVLDGVTRASRTGEAEIGADGSYRVEGLPLGRLVRVEARARGFSVAEVALDRQLEPDRSVALDVALARGAVVTGTVLDARKREPLPGARVWMEAFTPEEDSVHPATVADDQGRFRLEGANEELSFQDGQRFVFFWLVAEAEGHAAAPLRSYGAQANDEHVYDFEMLLEPAGCSLRVRAMLADGRPASGATLWAIDALGNPFWETVDDDGLHAFEALPAGAFALWLAYEETAQIPVLGLRGGPKLAEVSRGRHALRAELELSALETRSEEFVLQPPGKASLAGRVLDVDGRGVADFAVRSQLNFQLGGLMLASGWDETRTDGEGRYRFDGLHPGKYQVWASGEGTAMACALPGHTYVDVAAEQAAEVVDFRVGACFTIEGRVDGRGLELASLQLSARDPVSGADLAEARPAADGSFRFEPLVAQDYEVVLLGDGAVLDRATASSASATDLFLRAR